MISKEKYDLINTKCERNYPGICNYNLRYAADEIVHTIYFAASVAVIVSLLPSFFTFKPSEETK